MACNVVVDPEFESLIPPLAEDEYRGLEESILADGVRDAFDPRSRAYRPRKLREKLLSRDRRVLGKNNLKSEKDTTSAKPGDATDIFDEKTIDLIRRSGGQTGAYIDTPEGAQLDPYSQHMKAGQDLMGKNKFFDAEERFARALQEREGDVTAMAEAIERLATNPALRTRLAQGARRTAEALSWESELDRLAASYGEVIRGD